MIKMRSRFLSYVNGKSILHKLDPRTKIITLMILSIIIFHTHLLLSLLSIFIIFIAATLVSRVPFRRLLASLRPMMFFIVLVFLLHFLFMSAPVFEDVHVTIEIAGDQLQAMGDAGRESEAGAGRIYNTADYITVEVEPVKPFKNSDFSITPSFYSFITGLGVAMRFILLLLFASLMSATTKQSAIIQGIERLIRPIPLKWAGMTSYDLALMVLLTIRFIPLLASTGAQIKDSANSRAFQMKKHPFKAIQITAVGMVNSIVSFADDVSMAMQNRGYTGVGRTSMNELKFKRRDVLFFCGFIFTMITIIIAVGYLYLTLIIGLLATTAPVPPILII